MLVFRGENLGDAVNDTDPQQTGHKPLEAKGADPASQRTAQIANQFVAEAAQVLKDESPTNMVTLRGFARYPKIEKMQDVYGVKPAAIAVYPMYKGLGRLVGMDVIDAGATLADQVETMRRQWSQYDFFFVHFKYTDSTGEDGNFQAKVEMIERLDRNSQSKGAKSRRSLSQVITARPAGWQSQLHPVPLLLWAKTCRPDPVTEFENRPTAAVWGS